MSDPAEGKTQPESKPEEKAKQGPEPKRRGTSKRWSAASVKNIRIVAVAGLGLIAVVLGLIAILDDSENSSNNGTARIISVDELQEAAASGETPIYWAGTQAESELELSQPEAGRSFVRYLTGGAEAGDPGADFLTVATYADDHPVDALKRQGKEPGGVLASAPGGATVYFSRNDPHSVYLAYPGVAVQIEVYDPDFKRALQLVESGQVVSAD